MVDAERQFRAALTLARSRGLPNAVGHGLAGIAVVLADQGQSERGAMVLGAAEALRKRASESWHPAEESVIDRARLRMQADLGDSEVSLALLRGGMLSFVDAIALGLDTTLGSTPG